MNLIEMDPEVAFKPERRNLEYRFLQDQRAEIKSLNISEEDKMFMISKLWGYYREYNKQFDEYHMMANYYKMSTAFAALNRKMGFPKPN
jgi:hypothetical protein